MTTGSRRRGAKLAVTVAAVLVTFALRSATNDLSIARQALRDGLWELARRHAAADGSLSGKLVALESFAREERWADVKKELAAVPSDAADPGFAYYRAVVAGDFKKAAELLRRVPQALGAPDAAMLEADLRVKAGDATGAAELWRSAMAMTNASERVLATAALNLGDEASLRRALASVKGVALRQQVGLRLGSVLVAADKTFDEGEKMIRAIVREFPDATGAQNAFIALAAAMARRGAWKESAKTYADAIEIWPDAAKVFAVQEGRGEVFARLGRREEALASFLRAEALAKDDGEKALAVLKQGDMLTESGRGAEALARYRRVLTEFPSTEVAVALKRIVGLRELESKGRESFKAYRFADARKAFEKVAAEDPARRPRMAYFDVLCRYGLGEDAEAKSGARALAETCEDPLIRAEATLWLAKFTYNRSEWKESGPLFCAFASLVPDHAYAPQALAWAARAAYADGDFSLAIVTATRLVERYPASPARFAALLVQGEALIELARFGEAVLVLEQVSVDEGSDAGDRMRARLLMADALFAMGADNPARYTAALKAYRAIRFGGALEPSLRLSVSFKIARTLEKLKRYDEATDEYYSQVVVAYRDGRLGGERYDDDARAAFSRAAFRLAEDFESRGRDAQAVGVLRLVVESDVPAAEEARKRMERISAKGRFL